MRLHWFFMLIAILMTLFVVRYVRSWLRFSWRAVICLMLFCALTTVAIYFRSQSSSAESARPIQQSKTADTRVLR